MLDFTPDPKTAILNRGIDYDTIEGVSRSFPGAGEGGFGSGGAIS